MTEHISGQQARELLEGTTPGPWEWRHNDYPEHDEGYEVLWNGAETALRSQDSDQYSSWVTGSDRDKALAAAAPALAETVAWLYGREPQQSHASGGVFHCAEEEDNDLPWAVSSMPGEVSVTPTDRRDLTPDEAVDLARALLHAAVIARRHTD